MKDRRRWPRYPVSWQVRLFFQDGRSIVSRAVGASLHGLRVAMVDSLGALKLQRGDRCRIEVQLSDMARFVRDGEVRHVNDEGMGFEIPEPLPASILGHGAETASPSRNGDHAPEVLQHAEPTQIRPSVLGRVRAVLHRRLHVSL